MIRQPQCAPLITRAPKAGAPRRCRWNCRRGAIGPSPAGGRCRWEPS